MSWDLGRLRAYLLFDVFQWFLEVLIDGVGHTPRRRLVDYQCPLTFPPLLLLLLLLVGRHLPRISVHLARMGSLHPSRGSSLGRTGLFLQAIQLPFFPETRPNIASVLTTSRSQDEGVYKVQKSPERCKLRTDRSVQKTAFTPSARWEVEQRRLKKKK